MDDAAAIAAAAGLPSTSLRSFQVDPRLWHYVPITYAKERRVIPVTLVGDRLQLAVADPAADLSVLRRRFPNLTIDLHVAAATEIDAVLAAFPT